MQPLQASLERLAAIVRAEEQRPEIRLKVETRMQQFKDNQTADDEKWFNELSFCLLTANYSAKGALSCIVALEEQGLLQSGSLELVQVCLEHRHRFPRKRAEFIIKAREKKSYLRRTIQSQPNSRAARDWLIENILGLGMKEASHFLRNVGYFDLAIIDKHILSHMEEQKVIAQRPKNLTKKKYLEYEDILTNLAKILGMPLGKMDLYLWAKKSGEVLK
jgi:N-glycosylase/DNA lyase